MKVALGSDHAGFPAKEVLVKTLARAGYDVVDVGPTNADRTDYPDFAAAVGRAVVKGRVERGVLVCGTGIGMCMAANKIRGVRAAVVWSKTTAGLAAAHNNANVLCLSGRLFSPRTLVGFVRLWLTTPFEGGRHAGRVKKLMRLER